MTFDFFMKYAFLAPMFRNLCTFVLFTICTVSFSYGRQVSPSISVHDPVMIRQQDTYYIFCTGMGIRKWSSKDLKNWKAEKPVFNTAPKWAVNAVPDFKGHIWAPDISFYKGLYYLYYSVSQFGKNTSAIGLATNTTLNSEDPAYKWIDHGEIISSAQGRDNWNAIDPNFITDKKGKPYLAFGSFWGGLKLVQLSNDRKHLSSQSPGLITIASRKRNANDPNPIEAPFIFKKGRWFYLFASIDYCCRGPKSTYKIIVGRAKDLKGPYLDKTGTNLQTGGGTVLQAGDENWYGVGHNAVCSSDGKDYLVYHGYDAKDKGSPKLIIKVLNWQQGWPTVN